MLGDLFPEKIETHKGELMVRPVALEPVKDIAVLSELDNQAFP